MFVTSISDQLLAVVHTYNATAGLLQAWKHVGCFLSFKTAYAMEWDPVSSNQQNHTNLNCELAGHRLYRPRAEYQRKAVLRRNTKTLANEMKREPNKLKSHLSRSDLGPRGMLLLANENLGHYYDQFLVGTLSNVSPSIRGENLSILHSGSKWINSRCYDTSGGQALFVCYHWSYQNAWDSTAESSIDALMNDAPQ